MITSKAFIAAFAMAGNSFAQSQSQLQSQSTSTSLLSGWSLTTMVIAESTTVVAMPSGMPDFSGTVTSCPRSSVCDERMVSGEYSEGGCKMPSNIECQCVAYNSTGYANCIKEKCSNWESFLKAKLKTCKDLLKVDLSGNTTYTGMAMPTNTGTLNVTLADRDGLSMSDKIALGIGVGFGIPTIVIGVGTLIFMRRKKAAKAAKDLADAEAKANEVPSPQSESGPVAVDPPRA